MGSTYDIGDVVRITGTFTDTGGLLGDPSSVHFLFDTPSSTGPNAFSRTSTELGNVGGIVRLSTGVYYYDVASTGRGLYETRFTSTGTLAASGESWFSVRRQRVST